MQTIPEGLPPWAQALAAVLFLISSGAAIWKAVIKKEPVDAPATVLSATIADGQAMRDLVAALKDARNEVAELAGCVRTVTDVNRLLIDEQRSTRQALTDAQRSFTRAVDAMERKT